MTTIFLRFELSPDVRLGPGKVRLLEAIGEHGSISAAGRALGMSYRRAWLLVDELNRSFREPVVQTMLGGKGGGKAELTEFGREIVRRFRAMEEKARSACGRDLAALEAQLRA